MTVSGLVGLSLQLALALAIAEPAPAQATWRGAGRELRDVATDIGSIWASPIHADRKDWRVAGLVTVGAGALLFVDDQIDSWIVRHPRSALIRGVGLFREDNPVLGRAASARRTAPILGAVIVAGLVSDNRKLREAGYGCVTGWAATNSVRYALYAAFGRQRPYVANGDQFGFSVPGGGGWDSHSFLAGHAASAFACTTFLNRRFDLGIAEPALYTAATGISLARIADRRHWTSDTLLGSVFGYAAGRAIAARYARREEERAGGQAAAHRQGRATRPGISWTVLLWEQRF